MSLPKGKNNEGEAEPHEQQVVRDLTEAVEQYASIIEGVAQISRQTMIHKKTLLRILKHENKPSVSTILKIYRYIYRTSDDNLVLSKAPDSVREFLRKNSLKESPRKSLGRYEISVNEFFEQEPTSLLIYLLAQTGALEMKWIKTHFGVHGIELTHILIQKKVLRVLREGDIDVCEELVQLDQSRLLRSALMILTKYFVSEGSGGQSKNQIHLQMEGLNKEAYEEWIQVDIEAHRKKRMIAEDIKNKGLLRVFTVGCTGVINLKGEGSLGGKSLPSHST